MLWTILVFRQYDHNPSAIKNDKKSLYMSNKEINLWINHSQI